MLFSYGFWNRIGSFLAPLVLLLSEKRDPFNFRIPILTQWGFLGVMLPILLWIPETPAYFAARDQHEKGKAKLRRVNGKVEGYDIEAEYAIISNTILEERREQASRGADHQGIKQILYSYVQCFQRQNARRTLGAALPVCAQQLTGLAFLNGYASLFFRQSGFDDAFLITTIMSRFLPSLLVSVPRLTSSSRHRPCDFHLTHYSDGQVWPPHRRRRRLNRLHHHHAHRRHPGFRPQDDTPQELPHLRRLCLVLLQRGA
jgi:sugar transport protein